MAGKKSAAKKKAAPKKKPKKKPAPGEQAPYLMEVTIVWCDTKGRVRKKDIDLAKVGGLWWKNPNAAGDPTVPKVPGSRPKRLGRCDAPPPNGDDCCWFDGFQWRCPDDFA